MHDVRMQMLHRPVVNVLSSGSSDTDKKVRENGKTSE